MAGMNPPLSRTQTRTRPTGGAQPRTGPRLLLSWEDWLTLFAASLVFLSLAGAIQGAELVRNMPPMVPTAGAGLIVGLFVARLRMSQWLTHPAAIAIGALVVVMAAQGYADGESLADRLADFRLRMVEWYNIVRAGDVSNDNLPFVTLVHALTFLSAYAGTWAIFRWHNAWLAILPAGALLLITISLREGQPSTAFVFFLFGALFLLARLHLQKRQAQWRAQGIEYPEFMSVDAAQLTVLVAAVLMIAAWLVPLGKQANAVESTLETMSGPFDGTADRVVRVFNNVNAGGGGNFHKFGDVLPLRGDVNLGQRQLFELEGVQYVEGQEGLRLLRGSSYDEYTGVAWHATDRDRTRVDGGETAVTDEAAYLARIFTTLEITATDDESTVFFEGIPFGTNLDSVVDLPETFGADIEQVRSRRQLDEGDTYNAVGTVSVASADELRAAGTGYPEWVTKRYLQLPGDLPERVREQAQSVAGSASNPYDQAVAVESYLRGFRYDLLVPTPPPGRDAVDYILFDLQAGYFDYQASAMAVMLRSLGIPSRVAVGYAVDLGDEESFNEDGSYSVRKDDAYAWVEVFFPQYGWISFNPTPDRPRAATGDGDVLGGFDGPVSGPVEPNLDGLFSELDGEFPLPSGVGTSLSESPVDQDNSPLIPTWVLWTLAAALGVAALAAMSGYLAWTLPVRGLSGRARWWAQAQRLGGWAGARAVEGETAREWSRRAGETASEPTAARSLADAYEESRYGRPDLLRYEDSDAEQAYTALRKAFVRRILRRRGNDDASAS